MTSVQFFGCVSVTVGVVALVGGIGGLGRAIRSRFWPFVDGVITASTVVKEPIGDDEVIRASIRYTYAVLGQSHSGGLVRFVNLGTSDAAGVVARYPVGSVVRVFYSPSNAGLSVLEPGANWFQSLILPYGVFFCDSAY